MPPAALATVVKPPLHRFQGWLLSWLGSWLKCWLRGSLLLSSHLRKTYLAATTITTTTTPPSSPPAALANIVEPPPRWFGGWLLRCLGCWLKNWLGGSLLLSLHSRKTYSRTTMIMMMMTMPSSPPATLATIVNPPPNWFGGCLLHWLGRWLKRWLRGL